MSALQSRAAAFKPPNEEEPLSHAGPQTMPRGGLRDSQFEPNHNSAGGWAGIFTAQMIKFHFLEMYPDTI